MVRGSGVLRGEPVAELGGAIRNSGSHNGPPGLAGLHKIASTAGRSAAQHRGTPQGEAPVTDGGEVQPADAPVEALDSKMLQADSSFINVRFAGDPHC